MSAAPFSEKECCVGRGIETCPHFSEVLEREEEQRQELLDIAENYGAIMDALHETT